MNSSQTGSQKRCAPSFLACLSVIAACEGASKDISALKEALQIDPMPVRADLLRERIFFQHFMALNCLRYAIDDGKRLNSYVDEFLDSIRKGGYRPHIEEQNHFSIEAQDEAIQDNLFGFGGFSAGVMQDFYLHRIPSEDERRVIEDPVLSGEADYNPGRLDDVTYFSLALLARYCGVLSIQPRTLNYLRLFTITSSEALAATRLYMDALGIEMEGSASEKADKAPQPRKPSAGWLSRLSRWRI